MANFQTGCETNITNLHSE